MTVVSMLLMLVCVYGFSAVIVQYTKISEQTAPLAVLSTGIVWLTLAGCMQLLWFGGMLWFALGLGAFIWQAIQQKHSFIQLLKNSGFVLFLAGSLFLIALFTVRKPMFYQWDEFTFWGSAAKVTFESNKLYPMVQSNMVTTAYPPALPLLIYMFQFFGKQFAEWGGYAAYNILALACMATVYSPKESSKYKNILLLGICLLLPWFFEFGAASGVASTVYLNLQADLTLGLLFGSALAVYYHSRKTVWEWVQIGMILAALSLVKDMGLALGLIAVGIMAVDLLFVQTKYKASKRIAQAGSAFVGFSAIVVAGWLGWSMFVGAASGENRFDLGNAGETQTLGMAEMMIHGTKELLGIDRTAEFSQMSSAMAHAYLSRRICLVGSGIVVTGLILAVLAAAFFCGDKLHKKRVVLYTVVSMAGFAAFWVFHLFLYLYVFKSMEGAELKDYARYFMEYYLGWLFGALALLAMSDWKKRWAEYSTIGIFALIGTAIILRGQTVNNFMNYSDSFYQERVQVQQRAKRLNGVLTEQDRVYPILQGNDGTRWYYYGYELDSLLLKMYGGGDGTKENPYQPTTAATLTQNSIGIQQYEVITNQQNLVDYLKESKATVLFVDRADDYTAQLLQPYTKGTMDNSGLIEPTLYHILWQGDVPVFEPIPLEVTP